MSIVKLRQQLQRGNARFGAEFVSLPREEWPARRHAGAPEPLQVWRSNRFLVQVYDEPNAMLRLSILQSRLKSDGHWVDGITWDELQAIKDAIGFADCDAVEVYPRQCDIVNDANLRHLWVFPPGAEVPFAWRA